jgi:hypothetical protein
MEAHISATPFPDTNPAITNFVWSDGAWVSFNAETKQWTDCGFVPHPNVNTNKFAKPEPVPLADAPEYPTALLDGIPYRVKDGALQLEIGRVLSNATEWADSGLSAEDLRDYLPAAQPLIDALEGAVPRHSADCAETTDD